MESYRSSETELTIVDVVISSLEILCFSICHYLIYSRNLICFIHRRKTFFPVFTFHNKNPRQCMAAVLTVVEGFLVINERFTKLHQSNLHLI